MVSSLPIGFLDIQHRPTHGRDMKVRTTTLFFEIVPIISSASYPFLTNIEIPKEFRIFSIIGTAILIASGGVMNASDVEERLINSADLVQLYTGYIYQGNSLLKQALKISSP